MNASILPRLGAACGPIFAIVLLAGASDGSQTYSPARTVAGIAALTLAIPFLAAVASRLRAYEGPGWLSTAAVAAGAGGVILKLSSEAPQLALQRAHLTDAGQRHTVVQQIADSATVLSLFPLAIFSAATAIVALRTRALPIWIGLLAAITALALVVNGCFITTEAVPAMLLFILWSLVTGSYLILRPQPVSMAALPATA
jgi:hypothetical protein